jgi:hypothetical protein
LDHDDVTWDGSKGEKLWRMKEKEEKMRHGVLENEGVGGTCSKKP